MKRLLIFSIVVNLALLGSVAWRKTQQVTLPARKIRTESQPSLKTFEQRRARALSRSKSIAPWNKIENRDVRQFIANLREIGCPESIIRDIVTLRICRAYRGKVLELETELALKQSGNQNLDPAEWRTVSEKRQDLRDAMMTELESALGASWNALSSALTGFPTMGYSLDKILSADKRAQVREIDKQFRHDLDELRQKKMSWGLEPDEVATFRNLERQKQSALAALLSPSELDEYLYRNSPAADYVRRNLPEAKTEAEYRAMVKLAQEMEMSQTIDAPSQHFGAGNEESDLESKKRKEDYAQRLKELLGEDRIAEQKAQAKALAAAEAKAREEGDMQQMQQQVADLAAEVGVDAESANRFYERLTESKTLLTKK
ncbi:MAG: hypothetical protein ABJC04_09625, partial [Verrucomicrobiota bacterium]